MQCGKGRLLCHKTYMYWGPCAFVFHPVLPLQPFSRMDHRGSILGRGKGFVLQPVCPYQLWGPHSILSCGHRRSFPDGKACRQEWVAAIGPLPLTPTWRVRDSFSLLLHDNVFVYLTILSQWLRLYNVGWRGCMWMMNWEECGRKR
jgi:hypothetical protein